MFTGSVTEAKTVMTLRVASNDKTALAHWTQAPPATEDLYNEQWAAVEPILIRRYWSSEAAPAHRSAEARVLWSDKSLHILFNYPQQEPLVVSESPQTSGKAMRLWDRDVCEIVRIAIYGAVP